MTHSCSHVRTLFVHISFSRVLLSFSRNMTLVVPTYLRRKKFDNIYKRVIKFLQWNMPERTTLHTNYTNCCHWRGQLPLPLTIHNLCFQAATPTFHPLVDRWPPPLASVGGSVRERPHMLTQYWDIRQVFACVGIFDHTGRGGGDFLSYSSDPTTQSVGLVGFLCSYSAIRAMVAWFVNIPPSSCLSNGVEGTILTRMGVDSSINKSS